MDAPLNHAIEILGGVTKAATTLGISPQAIRKWKRVPTARLIEIESLTGIARKELRPDLYSGDALRRAIEIAGGPISFAAALGITPQAVWKWKRCPTHRIMEVERLTGIPREELRPDLYLPPRPRKPRGGQQPTQVLRVPFERKPK